MSETDLAIEAILNIRGAESDARHSRDRKKKEYYQARASAFDDAIANIRHLARIRNNPES